MLRWRDEQAAGKEVWLTEFGYDASTKPAPPTGDFAKWQGSTETQQHSALSPVFGGAGRQSVICGPPPAFVSAASCT